MPVTFEISRFGGYHNGVPIEELTFAELHNLLVRAKRSLATDRKIKGLNEVEVSLERKIANIQSRMC